MEMDKKKEIEEGRMNEGVWWKCLECLSIFREHDID